MGQSDVCVCVLEGALFGSCKERRRSTFLGLTLLFLFFFFGGGGGGGGGRGVPKKETPNDPYILTEAVLHKHLFSHVGSKRA